MKKHQETSAAIANLARQLPDDKPPPPPPPPLPPTPDIALQMSICLPDEMNEEIVATLQEALGPNADVRARCVNKSDELIVGIHVIPDIGKPDFPAGGKDVPLPRSERPRL